MNTLRVLTDGAPIETMFSAIWNHPSTPTAELTNLTLKINDTKVEIIFKTAKEMIRFCKKHNFEYEDERKIKA